MSSFYYKTTDPNNYFIEILPLESNGVDAQSTPRRVIDVEFLDANFAVPTDSFIVNDAVDFIFVQGFTFDLIGSGIYDDTYTVNAAGYLPGDTVSYVDGTGRTHIPVSNIPSPSNPVPYSFVTGSNVVVTLTTPGNYLVKWELDGAPAIAANDIVQFKRISYNDNVTSGVVTRNYVVYDVQYDVPFAGQTTVYTVLSDEQPGSTLPVIGVNADSVFLTPLPTTTDLGYIQYTINPPATSLMLVGKGAPLFNNRTSWGTAMQANMIHMMEHFAHTAPPVSPMDGQLWFDTTAGPIDGPVLNLYSNATWYGVVAEGLPVQGNINMNDFKIANITNATTTYPYVASSTGWGNNDQEVMNLGTSDAMYIAKTGGYTADPLVRSGTMTGSLNMTGTAGINFKSTGSGNLTFEDTTTGGIVVDGSGSVTVATGNVVATAGNMRVGSGTNQVVTQNNAGLAPTITFTTSTTANDVIDLNSNMLTGLTDAVNPTDAVSLQFADGRYVNVTGDTMIGTLAMSGSANITLADGDVVLGIGSNTLSLLRNGTAASTIVFNTSGATTATGNNVINLGTNMITGLSNAVNPTDAVSQQYGDDRYVNVTGDTMSGTLAMSGTANITLADGDIILGTGNNTVSVLRDGTAASSIVFNTSGATLTTGNNVIDLGTNMLTGLSTPILASDATNKAYVDSYVSGIIWLRPVLDPSLFDDTLSAPPVDDGFTEYHRTYIVAGTGTGTWTGFDGHLMTYDGTTWQSVLGRAVIIGDRFGVFCSPDNDDPLSTLPGGGLTGHSGKIVEVTGVSPYTYSMYTPAEPDAFSVVGVAGSAPYQSPHMGHSYTFRGQYGVGTYGATYSWIVFSGPQMVIDGAGLRYDANVLNTDGNLLSLYNLATTGFVARTGVDTVETRTIAGTSGNIDVTDGNGLTAPGPTINLAPVTQGTVGTSFVKVALDGFGRVTNNLAVTTADVTTLVDGTYVNVGGDTLTGPLVLAADPISALEAATKQYVDVGDQVGYEYFVVDTEVDTLGTIVPGYGYVAGSYTSVPLTGGTGTGATADITVTASAIDTVDTLVEGTLYTDGSYTSVPLTGGTGTGATADITVTASAIDTVGTIVPGYNYVAGSYTNVPLTGGTGTGATADITVTASAIDTVDTLIGGSLYTPGSYTNVPLTGGTGTGATADITVTVDAVTSVTIVNHGVGYTVADVLSASNTNLGGTGSGFSINVATVSGAVTAVTIVDSGVGYTVADTLSASNVDLGGAGTGFSVDVATVSGSIINTLNTLVGGTLYTDGSYTSVPLTGGTGTGATADITVSGGTVTVVTLVNPGLGYTVADVLSANSADVGGTGSGFSISVATVWGVVTVVTLVDHGVGYTVADVLSASNTNLGGTGSGFSINVATVTGAVTAVTIVNRGVGYTVADPLSASNVDLGGTGTGFGVPVSTTRAQTVYTLTNFAYVVGSHKLMVFVNGVKEIAPTNGNYTETSTSVFTFTPGILTAGNKIEAYRV